MNKVMNRQVALSAGGRPEDLAPYGIGNEHIDELMVVLARDLLQAGRRLAFGGVLTFKGLELAKMLTQILIDTSQSWLNENSAKEVDVRDPSTWPMVNYSPWPYHQQLNIEYGARLVGICEFIKINPPEMEQVVLDASKCHTANALTAMRERMTRESMLRICWGGRIFGAAGWLPGILEEVVMSLKFAKPLLILGGFGGCARKIADFLDPDADPIKWSQVFKIPVVIESATDADLVREERQILEQRYAEAEQYLTHFRDALRTANEINGVPTQLQRSVLKQESVTSMRKTVRDLLNRLNA